MSNKPPIEVPQGAIRLNTDSQKLEFLHRIGGMRWRLMFPHLQMVIKLMVVGGGWYNWNGSAKLNDN